MKVILKEIQLFYVRFAKDVTGSGLEIGCRFSHVDHLRLFKHEGVIEDQISLPPLLSV